MSKDIQSATFTLKLKVLFLSLLLKDVGVCEDLRETHGGLGHLPIIQTGFPHKTAQRRKEGHCSSLQMMEAKHQQVFIQSDPKR